MKERILSSACSNLHQALHEELPFKIAIESTRLLQLSNLFEYGTSEYGFDLLAFLDIKWVGISEMSFASRFTNLVSAIYRSTSVLVLQDQHDASSNTGARPDISIFCNNAICVKMEFKADAALLPIAKEELVSKFSAEASWLFPMNDRTMVGFVGAPFLLEMYLITYVMSSRSFVISNLVIDAFKLCR